MNKIIILILFFNSLNSVRGTPEIGDIIEDPLTFSEWDYCFILKKNKKDSDHIRKVSNGEEIKKYMKEKNLYSIYFQDCKGEKQWRKITRK